MILPIHLYGNPALRKKAEEISPDYPELDTLIQNMFETMYKAEGIGLAAPQVGVSIMLFIVDASSLAEDDEDLKDFKRVIINPVLSPVSDETMLVEEGCLSIPGVREKVKRYKEVELEYYNEKFEKITEIFTDFKAVIIQHEYDHLKAKVFTDKVSGLKKHIVNKKLNNIKKKKTTTFYKAKY